MALGMATTMARARGAGLRPGQNCLLVSQKPAASYQPNGRVQWRITVHCAFSPPTQRSADLGHSQRSGAPGVTDLEEQKSPYSYQQPHSAGWGGSVSLWHFQAQAWCLHFDICLQTWWMGPWKSMDSVPLPYQDRRPWTHLTHVCCGKTKQNKTKNNTKAKAKKINLKPKCKQNPKCCATPWVNCNYMTVATLENIHFVV